jgi:hypothetical protein
MPESLTIGAFVFGAVLILVALLGGNFKLFGAEINATVGRSLRAVALMLGLGFVGYALFGGGAPPLTTSSDDARRNSGRTTNNAGIAGDDEAVSPRVGGRWHDNLGGYFEIRQRGSQLSFEGYNASAAVSSRGVGSIDGNVVTYTFTTDIPSNGTARLRLAPDGNSASGVVQDSVEGRYSVLLTRDF